jgi:hypothetical protein
MALSAPDGAGRGRPTRDARARPERLLEDDGLAVPPPDGFAERAVAGPRTPPPAADGSAGGDAAEDMTSSMFRDPRSSAATTWRGLFYASRRNVAHTRRKRRQPIQMPAEVSVDEENTCIWTQMNDEMTKRRNGTKHWGSELWGHRNIIIQKFGQDHFHDVIVA